MKRQDSRRAGLLLIAGGAAGALFFVGTDPGWSHIRGASSVEYVDQITKAAFGTMVGLIGSGVVALIGLWLVFRRAA